MNSYILLRNNKESASLTIDGLKEMGLKATDLVWVECQSVCWQHPYEIAELKSLVGGVPEYARVKTIQPLEDIVMETVAPVVTNPRNESTEIIKEYVPEKVVEKKSVYVEMPAKKKTINEYAKPVADAELNYMHQYAGISKEENKTAATKQEDINTKYSRPLDEIKELYVKNLVQKERNEKNKFAVKIPPQAKRIAVYAGLVLFGAVVMYFFTNGNDKPKVIVQQVPQQAVQQAAITPADPVNGNETTLIASENSDNSNEQPAPTSLTAKEERKPVSTEKNPVDKKATSITEDAIAANEKNEIKTLPVSDVKETKEVKIVPAENIASRLSLKPNNFVVGSFGGIRNLEMTLQNDSKYALTKVTAEIQYLNPEGILLKTDNIYFQSIAPGETSTVAVPKTKRGVKIAYKIIKIEPKEINSSTAGL